MELIQESGTRQCKEEIHSNSEQIKSSVQLSSVPLESYHKVQTLLKLTVVNLNSNYLTEINLGLKLIK